MPLIRTLAESTSVYVVDRVVPMLPHALCNGICSLNQEWTITLTCCMDIDKKVKSTIIDISFHYMQ